MHTFNIETYSYSNTLRSQNETKRNVLRFLHHGTYHVVVRGGSHFCQSPKGGGSGVFSLKRKGGPTLFWEKNPKIPQPSPPQEKTYLPLLNLPRERQGYWSELQRASCYMGGVLVCTMGTLCKSYRRTLPSTKLYAAFICSFCLCGPFLFVGCRKFTLLC